MRTRILALALAMSPMLAATFVAAPAAAQTREDQYRWDQAQRRFENERAIFQQEQARYQDSIRRGSYRRGPGGGGYGDRDYTTDYDASRYYRDDARYQERALGPDDQVYRGSDGRYYCRRSDGTTGLIIGAGAGALIGNALDGGRHRAGGTILGGALGAILGSQVERSQNDVRCR